MEMMVTVAILALIARLAVPTYQSYVLRGKVSQAFSQLSSLSIGMQQVYQDNRTYVVAATNANGCPSSGAGAAPLTAGDFNILCSNMTATTFTLTASGKTGSSVASWSYTLDQSGARATSTPSGAAFPSNASCWVASSSGACY